jgi:subtilase family serine protease
VIAGQPGAPPKIPGALSPAQLIAAYDVGPLLSRAITGKGQTIVIIDPLGSPTIEQDLATYDKAWHLPAPPSFRIVAPAGPVPPYRPTRAQFEVAVETTMDVEAAHLMAPGAGLVLVEIPADWAVPRAGLPSLVRAAQYVIRHHLGSVISMSLGATETWFPVARAHRALLRAGLAHPMITMVAGSGDTGAAGATRDHRHVYPTPRVGWPASDPRVVAVGGTRLELGLQAASMAVAPATAWPRSGGGRSAVFPRPAYQRTVPGLAGRWRMIPDISLDAAGLSRLEIYAIPLGGTKWDATYGTSLAAPLFAGVVALADQAAGRPLGNINPLLYRLAAQHDPGIVDVRGPGNTFRFGGAAVRGFPAGPGYDLVTGLGTIDAAKFVPDLARLARQGPG